MVEIQWCYEVRQLLVRTTGNVFQVFVCFHGSCMVYLWPALVTYTWIAVQGFEGCLYERLGLMIRKLQLQQNYWFLALLRMGLLFHSQGTVSFCVNKPFKIFLLQEAGKPGSTGNFDCALPNSCEHIIHQHHFFIHLFAIPDKKELTSGKPHYNHFPSTFQDITVVSMWLFKSIIPPLYYLKILFLVKRFCLWLCLHALLKKNLLAGFSSLSSVVFVTDDT